MSLESHQKIKGILAHPVDRLGAFFVDFGILACLLFLVFAPFKRQILIYDLASQIEQMEVWLFLSSVALAIVGTSYHALFLRVWGATPGKLLFGLRVVDFWSGARPSWKNAYLRASVWWFDSLLLLIPHLAVIANKHRRPMHDRLADTVVVSISGRAAHSPSLRETLVGQSLSALVMGVFSAVVVTQVWSFVNYYGQGKTVFERMGSYQRRCEDVSVAEETWPYDVSRLEIAIALHGASIIDDDCLDKEAQVSFLSEESSELTYLARAFVVSSQPSLSDSYLEKVCEIGEGSETCEFARIIVLWTERKWEEATERFESLLPNASTYVKVWAVKHFERIENFETEVDLLNDLWSIQPLSKFSSSHMISAYWGLGQKEQARVAFRTVLNNLDADERLGLSSWYCIQEMKTSCSQESLKLCEPFQQYTSNYSVPLETDMLEVAQILYSECSAGESLESKAIGKQLASSEAVELTFGMEMARLGKFDKARNSFRNIRDAIVDAKSLIRQEASERLASVATIDDLEEMKKDWIKGDPHLFGWRDLGKKIFHRYSNLEKNLKAFEVGKRLLEFPLYDQGFHKEFVVLAFELGEKRVAWSHLPRSGSIENRSPASSLKFDQIRMKLEREFGAP